MVKKVAVIYAGGRHWGGIETFLLNLFNYHDKEKVELVLYSLGDWPLTRKINKIEAGTIIFSKTRFQPLTILKIAKQARRQGINLIVSGGLVGDSYARAGSLFSGIPHLSIVHSDFDLDYPNVILRIIYRFALFISAWRTKKYITVSEYLKKKLIKKGIAPEKISVVYNGVVSNNKKIINDKQKQKIIISAGRLHRVKNYESLIIAMKKIGGYQLKIYGNGPEKTKLENLLNELNLSNRVTLCGHVDNLEKAFRESEIYVQPSFSEGFGLAVVEAMLAGVPVVVTPGGALPELVKNNQTGIIADGFNHDDLIEAIERYINNPDLMSKCAQNGQKFAEENFNIKKWITETESIFSEVAK